MVFTKRLRDGVRRGEITCSVRIWTRPHVQVGARYRMDEGEIEVDSIEPIGFLDITPQLARESGFLGVIDLLKVAKHGKGENIYLVRFQYLPPPHQGLRTAQASPKKYLLISLLQAKRGHVDLQVDDRRPSPWKEQPNLPGM
jgi:hypothetical protein